MSENKAQTMVEYVEQQYLGKVKDEIYDLKMELATAHESRGRLYNILFDDTRMAFEQLDKQPDSQFYRRTLVRTLFAHIEAELSMMRQMAFTWHRLGAIKLTDDDLSKLADDIRVVWGEAQAPKKAIRQNLIETLKFTFRVFGSMPGKSIITIDTNSPGYRSFLRAVKVRNDLMHPKVEESLLISDTNGIEIFEAWNWYMQIRRQVLLPGEGELNL